MMRANRFRYRSPSSASEAAAILAGEGPSAMLLAGGTDLVPNMKRRQQTPETIVSLRRAVALRTIDDQRRGETAIGSCATLSDVAGLLSLGDGNHALVRAAAQVATPLIRNAATIGGNLCLDTRCNYYNQNHEWRRAIDFCKKAPAISGGRAVRTIEEGNDAICWVAVGSPRCWAVSSSDTAPALIALGASVSLLSSADGVREISLDEFYADDGMDFLRRRPDEVLTEIRLPDRSGWRSTYWKLRRRDSFDFPVLGVAAAIRLGPHDEVEDARVVLGAVASRPLLLRESSMLLGKTLGDDLIDEFAEAASRWAKPLDNTDFHMTWRKRVARTYLAGALRELRGDDPSSFGGLARHASRTIPSLG